MSRVYLIVFFFFLSTSVSTPPQTYYVILSYIKLYTRMGIHAGTVQRMTDCVRLQKSPNVVSHETVPRRALGSTCITRISTHIWSDRLSPPLLHLFLPAHAADVHICISIQNARNGERSFLCDVPVRRWEITSVRGYVHYSRTTLTVSSTVSVVGQLPLRTSKVKLYTFKISRGNASRRQTYRARGSMCFDGPETFE